jgi:hypothetical protein
MPITSAMSFVIAAPTCLPNSPEWREAAFATYISHSARVAIRNLVSEEQVDVAVHRPLVVGV